MKIALVLTFLLSSALIYSQEKFEYLGTVMLNGDIKSVISYRVVFAEKKGVVSGYSVTDLGGAHETKNVISGTYDAKTKTIKFAEQEILYTKSPISDDMFCFINFTGKVKLVNDNSAMEGAFKGFFKNKTKCIDGTLRLIGSSKLYKRMAKMDAKIQKSKRVDAATKEKVKPLAILDSLRVNNLLKNENLNVFVSSKALQLQIWDAGKEDGDEITIYQNDKVLLKDYRVTNKIKTLPIIVSEGQTIKILAQNEGTIAPNTVQISLIDGDRNFELMSSLKKGESASITIISKK